MGKSPKKKERNWAMEEGRTWVIQKVLYFGFAIRPILCSPQIYLLIISNCRLNKSVFSLRWRNYQGRWVVSWP